MKTILVILLLVSSSAFAQSGASGNDFSERHRQKLERQAEERGREMREQAQHEQHMRQLQNNQQQQQQQQQQQWPSLNY